jgi:hypothetical protein
LKERGHSIDLTPLSTLTKPSTAVSFLNNTVNSDLPDDIIRKNTEGIEQKLRQRKITTKNKNKIMVTKQLQIKAQRYDQELENRIKNIKALGRWE